MQQNPNEMPDALKESIDEVRSFQEKMKEATTQTEDVKNGDATPEEEQQEPAYILSNQISENTINIMSTPTFVKGFQDIATVLGVEVAKNLISMIAVGMAHSATSAIAFYDELLKKELDKQFDNYGTSLNKLAGTVNGHTGVLSVFKEKIGNIEKKLQLTDLKEDPNNPNT